VGRQLLWGYPSLGQEVGSERSRLRPKLASGWKRGRKDWKGSRVLENRVPMAWVGAKHGPRQAHAGLFRPSSRFPLPYPALVSANQKSGPSLQVPSSATPGSALKFTRAGFPSRLLHEFHYRRLREPSRRSFHLSQQQSSSQIPHQIGPQIQSSPWLAATQYRLPGSHRALSRTRRNVSRKWWSATRLDLRLDPTYLR
jgi:hypothetical protein